MSSLAISSAFILYNIFHVLVLLLHAIQMHYLDLGTFSRKSNLIELVKVLSSFCFYIMPCKCCKVPYYYLYFYSYKLTLLSGCMWFDQVLDWLQCDNCRSWDKTLLLGVHRVEFCESFAVHFKVVTQK
jgi:hypothetical protein